MVLDGYTNPASWTGVAAVARRAVSSGGLRWQQTLGHGLADGICMAKLGCHWILGWVFLFICFITPLFGSDVGARSDRA